MKRAAAAAAAAALLAPAVTSSAAPAPQVVTITVAGPTGAAERATGFVAGDERVVTVAHAVAGNDDLVAGGHDLVAGRHDSGAGARTRKIVVRGDDGLVRRAHVLRVDRRLDLAVLDVPGLRAPAAHTGGGDELRVLVARDDRVESLDAPVRRHIRAYVDGAIRPALELAADVARGDSGAPVVTPGGRIAGVVFARSTGRTNTAYAVTPEPLDRLLISPRSRDRAR